MGKHLVALVLLGLAAAGCTGPISGRKSPARKTNLEQLRGFKPADLADLAKGESITLDGETQPVYTEDGTRLRGNELVDQLMSGRLNPEPYVDDSGRVRAFLLRALTAEELEAREAMDMKGLIGQPARPFSVADVNGRAWSLDALTGRVVVANFWFVGCKPCVEEIPELNRLVESFAGKDIVFLGFTSNDKSTIGTFLSRHPFKYNVIPDSEGVIDSYGVRGFPTHMIIGKDSRIAFAASGLGPSTVSDLRAEIARLLGR
jgi:peroxiredoxin